MILCGFNLNLIKIHVTLNQADCETNIYKLYIIKEIQWLFMLVQFLIFIVRKMTIELAGAFHKETML